MVSEVKFTHQLPGQKWYSLDRELEAALNKEVLKRLAKVIDCHRIETIFRTKPMDSRDTSPSLKLCVDMKLVVQGVNRFFDLLKFNDDVVSWYNVMCKIYFICVSSLWVKWDAMQSLHTYKVAQTQSFLATCISQLIESAPSVVWPWVGLDICRWDDRTHELNIGRGLQNTQNVVENGRRWTWTWTMSISITVAVWESKSKKG